MMNAKELLLEKGLSSEASHSKCKSHLIHRESTPSRSRIAWNSFVTLLLVIICITIACMFVHERKTIADFEKRMLSLEQDFKSNEIIVASDSNGKDSHSLTDLSQEVEISSYKPTASGDSSSQSDHSAHARRMRRQAPDESGATESKSTKSGIHLSADVDEDRLIREQAEGIPSSIGNINEWGLQPNDRIYKIWTPEEWSSRKYFRYNSTSGKIKVKTSGTYLIYGQILFHGPAARKSYGIHINDEIVPFVEALSFDNIHNLRRRRSLRTEMDDQPWQQEIQDPLAEDESMNQRFLDHLGGVQGSPDSVSRQRRALTPDDPDLPLPAEDTSSPAELLRRSKRSSYASYSQCNTQTVAFLKKNDEVFLRSMDIYRTIIPRRNLTFWGMAKL